MRILMAQKLGENENISSKLNQIPGDCVLRVNTDRLLLHLSPFLHILHWAVHSTSIPNDWDFDAPVVSQFFILILTDL